MQRAALADWGPEVKGEEQKRSKKMSNPRRMVVFVVTSRERHCSHPWCWAHALANSVSINQPTGTGLHSINLVPVLVRVGP